MESNSLVVEADAGVGRIRLNRPESLNAIDLPMLEDLMAAAHFFNGRSDVRVVVVEGEGRAFCSGYNVAAFGALSDDPLERRNQAALGGEMADVLESMKAVTIARLHGWVVGGGLVIASTCDLRIAASDTRFKIPEVQLGIPLNWAGIPRLVREIGPALTKELVMTCREFSADEARAAGFLNRVVDIAELDETVDHLAETLLSMPAVPVAATKEQVNAVTKAMAARVGSYMDGEGMTAAMSSPEFLDNFTKYRSEIG